MLTILVSLDISTQEDKERVILAIDTYLNRGALSIMRYVISRHRWPRMR